MSTDTPTPIKPYYHGGVGNKRPGEIILPPFITGAKSSLDYIPASQGNTARRDKVYITTSFEAAMMYAATTGSRFKGGLYEVEPIGQVEIDPDYTGDDQISYCCDKAKITKKHPLSQNEIDQIRSIVLADTPPPQP